jgi:FKBP-type peptidyl-prolyl cis-trans isomerase 2
MKTNDYDPNADIESSSGISGKSRGSGSSNSKLGGASSYKHSAVERGPFTFVLGEGTLIRGWEEGLVGMCVGEVRKLTIPRSMAYTRYADSEDNPMSKGLVYEIELLELYKAE